MTGSEGGGGTTVGCTLKEGRYTVRVSPRVLVVHMLAAAPKNPVEVPPPALLALLER